MILAGLNETQWGIIGGLAGALATLIIGIFTYFINLFFRKYKTDYQLNRSKKYVAKMYKRLYIMSGTYYKNELIKTALSGDENNDTLVWSSGERHKNLYIARMDNDMEYQDINISLYREKTDHSMTVANKIYFNRIVTVVKEGLEKKLFSVADKPFNNGDYKNIKKVTKCFCEELAEVKEKLEKIAVLKLKRTFEEKELTFYASYVIDDNIFSCRKSKTKAISSSNKTESSDIEYMLEKILRSYELLDKKELKNAIKRDLKFNLDLMIQPKESLMCEDINHLIEMDDFAIEESIAAKQEGKKNLATYVKEQYSKLNRDFEKDGLKGIKKRIDNNAKLSFHNADMKIPLYSFTKNSKYGYLVDNTYDIFADFLQWDPNLDVNLDAIGEYNNWTDQLRRVIDYFFIKTCEYELWNGEMIGLDSNDTYLTYIDTHRLNRLKAANLLSKELKAEFNRDFLRLYKETGIEIPVINVNFYEVGSTNKVYEYNSDFVCCENPLITVSYLKHIKMIDQKTYDEIWNIIGNA